MISTGDRARCRHCGERITFDGSGGLPMWVHFDGIAQCYLPPVAEPEQP